MVGGRKCFGPDNADPAESFDTINCSDSAIDAKDTELINLSTHFNFAMDINETKDMSEIDSITDETLDFDITESVKSIDNSSEMEPDFENGDVNNTLINNLDDINYAISYVSEKLTLVQDSEVFSYLMKLSKMHIKNWISNGEQNLNKLLAVLDRDLGDIDIGATDDIDISTFFDEDEKMDTSTHDYSTKNTSHKESIENTRQDSHRVWKESARIFTDKWMKNFLSRRRYDVATQTSSCRCSPSCPCHCSQCRPTTHKVQNKPISDAVLHKPTDDAVLHKPTDEAVLHKSTDEAVLHKSTDDAVLHKPTDEAVLHKSIDDAVLHKPNYDAVFHNDHKEYDKDLPFPIGCRDVKFVTIEPEDSRDSLDGNKGIYKRCYVALDTIETNNDDGNMENKSMAKRKKTEEMVAPAVNDDCISSRTRYKVKKE